jgi:hypothetical protein
MLAVQSFRFLDFRLGILDLKAFERFAFIASRDACGPVATLSHRNRPVFLAAEIKTIQQNILSATR